MLTMFEEPKKITLKEYFENKNSNTKYVQKFSYGDYDNNVIAILHDVFVALQFTHPCEGGYKVSLREDYIHVNTAEAEGYLNASYHPFTGYGDSHFVRSIDDIYKIKIKVDGTWIEDRFVKKEGSDESNNY